MIELQAHIEYLLLHASEVSVPQLGTFISREMSSRRVDEEGIFLPPYRTVSFQWNEQEAGDDFIRSFAKMHNLPRHDARMVCMEYVEELLQALEEDGSVPFGSMGYMLRNAETGEISFMPQQSGIASPAYYGLDAVPFAKLSHEMRQQRDKRRAARKTRLTSIQADQDTITIRINRRAFNYASAIAASIVLFFAIKNTAPFQLPRGEEIVQQAAALFFSPKEEVKQQEVTAVTSVEEVSPRENTNIEETAAAPYVIVLACAISEERAVSYAAALQEQGYNAQACIDGKMVRVIIPGFATEEEASEKIHQCKAECSDFAQAWPYQLKGEVKSLK